MRWRILRTLLHKEALRHATNRGGLALAGLLVSASLLLAALNPGADEDRPATLVGGIHHCIILYQDEREWIRHLREHLPDGLRANVFFRQIDIPVGPDENLKYETGTGGIEIRSLAGPDDRPNYRVWVRYPEGDRAGMAVYENWFWRESYRFFHAKAAAALEDRGVKAADFPRPALEDDLWSERLAFQKLADQYAALSNSSPSSGLPAVELRERAVVGGALDMRAAIATAL